METMETIINDNDLIKYESCGFMYDKPSCLNVYDKTGMFYLNRLKHDEYIYICQLVSNRPDIKLIDNYFYNNYDKLT